MEKVDVALRSVNGNLTFICIHVQNCLGINVYMKYYNEAAFFWSGLKSRERPKIEQLLILPSLSHLWKDQKYDAKLRKKDAKDQLFDTKTVSLNPSLLAQK